MVCSERRQRPSRCADSRQATIRGSCHERCIAVGEEGRALVANLSKTRSTQGFRGPGVTPVTRFVIELRLDGTDSSGVEVGAAWIVLAIRQRKVHCVTWSTLAGERARPRCAQGDKNAQDHDPLRSEGLAAEASEAVATAPLPAAIIEVASGRIMAASPPMREMFASDGGTVLGRTVDEFMTDQPSGALDLLRAGRLQGYVTTRSLRRRQEQPMPVQVWVRALGTDTPPRFAVAVFATSLTRTGVLLPEVARSDLTPVVGTSDESLLIDRISSDVEALLGYRPSDLLGRSILSLVTNASVPDLLGLLAHAAATGAGVTLNLVACSKQGDPVLLEAVLWPLRPPPRCGFALLPGADAESAFGTAADVRTGCPGM